MLGGIETIRLSATPAPAADSSAGPGESQTAEPA